MSAKYQKLKKISKNISLLEGISSLLDWDQETHMPPDGAPIRSEQLELLAGIIHQEKIGKTFSEALEALIDLKTGAIYAKDLSEREKKALLFWRRDYLKATALPTSFVEKLTKLSSQSMQAWRFAKQNDSFQHFAPFLEQIIKLSQEKAEYLGYKQHPYDALLDLYEPGLTTERISTLFTSLKHSIKHLLHQITAAKQIDDSFLFGEFPRQKQIDFALALLETIGYDKRRGSLDFSAHPFSSAAHPTDSRITTWIHPHSLMSCILSTLHEAGHGMYEMGLPAEEFGTPLGQSLSLGIHESQSRWWETRIGQNESFWFYFLPKLKDAYPGRFDSIDLNIFYKAINKVEPSFIRTEADEVTYSLHVILRFEIEKELMEGTLHVRDIPDAWNGKMKTLLRITPPTHREGCLQDIHWSMGELGYFPSYALGNIYASHLFSGFEKMFPEWEERVAKGEFLFIKQWLNENVHRYGRQYTSLELLEKGTGQPLSHQPYTQYLNQKYQKIYKLDSSL